jgi:hypothetical protein
MNWKENLDIFFFYTEVYLNFEIVFSTYTYKYKISYKSLKNKQCKDISNLVFNLLEKKKEVYK